MKKLLLYFPLILMSATITAKCTKSGCKKDTPPAASTPTSTPTIKTQTIKTLKGGSSINLSELIELFGDAQTALTELKKKDKVVLDFFATWCGPCKRLSPRIDKSAKKYSDIIFVKIDVDEFPTIAKEYDVMSMPTLIFIQNGSIVHAIKGAPAQADLEEQINDRFK